MAKKFPINRWKSLFLAMALVIAAGPETASAQSSNNVYAQQCAACHGATGKGDGPAGKVMQPPVVPFSSALKGKSDSWIESVIAKGGPAYGLSPAMPPHPSLSANQLKDLTDYIKGLNS